MPNSTVELRTTRLLLRGWRDDDLERFAALNADPVVMEHFPAPLTREQSDAFVQRIRTGFAANGYGLWAVEVVHVGELAGFVGLNPVPPTLPITAGGPEVGWRLARRWWGQGIATEAARAAVAHGFDAHRFPEIVSFTATTNVRSQAVMRRLGMTRDRAEDFDHPALPEGHRLRRHVLYRLASPPIDGDPPSL